LDNRNSAVKRTVKAGIAKPRSAKKGILVRQGREKKEKDARATWHWIGQKPSGRGGGSGREVPHHVESRI